MNSNILVGIVERARNINRRLAFRVPQDVGTELNQMWYDLRAATVADIDESMLDIVEALTMLDERGARITNWMITHTRDDLNPARHLRWVEIARKCDHKTAVSV